MGFRFIDRYYGLLVAAPAAFKALEAVLVLVLILLAANNGNDNPHHHHHHFPCP